MKKMSALYQTSFPALRGYQAGRAYYVTMCPLELISSLFDFDTEDESDPVARAQRKLNKARIPELAAYMITNPKDYVFSALTASVDGDIKFTAATPETPDTGVVTLPTSSQFVINDGQHRRAAIQEALKQRPELQDETIAVVLFVDRGLRRSQQMFADLNKNAVRPTKSLGILYDHRDQLSQLARQLMVEVPVFQKLTETEKSTISNRSRKLFTLSTIYFSTRLLLKKRPRSPVSIEEQALAKAFWVEVCKNMSEWRDLAKSVVDSNHPRYVTAGQLRTDYVHAHGVAVQAIALAGAGLQEQETSRWREQLKGLGRIDWHRSNRKLWEGRAMIGGRMTNSQNNVTLTANVIKKTLGVALTQDEAKVEDIYDQGQS